MRRMGTVCAFIFLASLVSGCNDEGVLIEGAPWTEFTSPEGQFKVTLPGTPARQSQFVVGTSLTMYGLEGKDLMYGVGYADLPIALAGPESPAVTDQRLNGGVQGSVNNIKATLTRQTTVYLAGKYP